MSQTAQPQSEYAVEMLNITRGFAHVIANDNVTLQVRQGEVHALVGENGAGKSTLMKILYGLYRPESGEIRVNGKLMRFQSPADAIAAGIGMVHQHFMLILPFTVAENVVLGDERCRSIFFDFKEAVERVAALAQKYAIPIRADALISDLSVGEQQRVEILKILYRNASIIILDEPTAVLTPQEVDVLFETIRQLARSGKTIIIITHKLHEVMALSQRLTVLRDGKVVGTLETHKTSPEEIARLMVGHDVVLPTLARDIEKAHAIQVSQTPVTTQPTATTQDNAPALISSAMQSPSRPQHVVLEVQSLELRRGQERPRLSNVQFKVHAGEIVGIAGVEGNGQKELLEVLTGLSLPTAGRIVLCGRDVTKESPRKKFACGMACIPEDRHRQGLILDFTLRENLLLGRHHDWRFARQLTWEASRRLLEDFDVRPADPRARASHLSGGNQQKVIVAREFTRGASFLLAAHPTRGIDLGAIEFIHRKLLELRAQGVGILLISAELSEILALSDRVLVMYGGKIVYEAENKELDEKDLGIYMAGGMLNTQVAGKESRP